MIGGVVVRFDNDDLMMLYCVVWQMLLVVRVDCELRINCEFKLFESCCFSVRDLLSFCMRIVYDIKIIIRRIIVFLYRNGDCGNIVYWKFYFIILFFFCYLQILKKKKRKIVKIMYECILIVRIVFY